MLHHTASVGLLAGLVLANAAWAQPEQWLQYHTSREGRSYRWLDLTTNPPPNVALPKLGAKPYFAHWTTALDPKGRWLCFDRARRSGPYDRLFIDSTGNGRLDDKSAIKSSRTDPSNTYFDPVRLLFKGEDGPITYHLVLRFMNYDSDNDVRLLLMSGGFYAGTIDLGGKKRRLELIDANVNGAFNDLASNPDACDHIVLGNDNAGERSLGRLLEVDGQFYRLDVARDGAFIKVQKAENVVLGKVRLPATISEFTALGEQGHFTRKPAKGELTLPVGSYRISQYLINRKDERGASWQLMGYAFNSAADFEVAADKPAALELGEPVRMVVQPSESAAEVSFSLRFLGPYNESMEITKGSERPRPPRLTLTSLDGSYRYTNTFEFG
ncbi:MAG: hypothetical protein ABSF95_13730 [Verrucomicrobiota bacterium]|jgi:hypothetical protein